MTNLAAVCIAIALPSVVTWLYFFQAEGTKSDVQVVIFGGLKVSQFAFPILWIYFAQRKELQWSFAKNGSQKAGIVEGLLFGGVVSVSMFVLYFGLLRGSPAIASAVDPIRAKVAGFGIDSLAKYIALGLFYSLIHSLLEEYYWRWFVFGQLRRQISLAPAIAISSLGFMAHHVLVLGKYFGFVSWQTVLFSASVAIGGAVWAWLYDRHRSLVGPWISHLLVDAAIFTIGYDLVRSVWAG